MRWPLALLSLALLTLPGSASAEPQVHTVADGQVLGKIAKRYHVSIEALCNANGISRREKLHLGQRLLIPDPDDKDGSRAAEEQNVSPAAAQDTPKPSGALQELELEGHQRAFLLRAHRRRTARHAPDLGLLARPRWSSGRRLQALGAGRAQPRLAGLPERPLCLRHGSRLGQQLARRAPDHDVRDSSAA
ncbi:MAG: LysM domain-containing protein [Polyangiaceae bacterium]